MTELEARLTRELLDLRDHVRRCESQIFADAEYLRVLLENEDALSEDWKSRVEAKLKYMAEDWPDVLKPRGKD